MNLHKLFVTSITAILMTYICIIMYIGNKLIFKVLDKNVVYSPLLQQRSQIIPGFEKNISIPHYNNMNTLMKISLLLLNL